MTLDPAELAAVLRELGDDGGALTATDSDRDGGGDGDGAAAVREYGRRLRRSRRKREAAELAEKTECRDWSGVLAALCEAEGGGERKRRRRRRWRLRSAVAAVGCGGGEVDVYKEGAEKEERLAIVRFERDGECYWKNVRDEGRMVLVDGWVVAPGKARRIEDMSVVQVLDGEARVVRTFVVELNTGLQNLVKMEIDAANKEK